MEELRRKETNEEIKERQAEATTKETLSDLSSSEKLPGSKQPSLPDSASVPSPDGQVDDDGRRDRVDVP